MGERKDTKFRVDHWPIWIAFLGLIAMVAIALLRLEPSFGNEEHKGQTVWQAFMSLKLNEMGDTFAGLFGSLAFLAAALAVFLQSRELRAQREELRLTRAEMKEQREATQDMARSAKATAEILEGEKRTRDEQAAQELLDQHLVTLWDFLNSNRFPKWRYHVPNGKGGANTGHLTLSDIVRVDMDIDGKLELFRKQVVRQFGDLQRYCENGNITERPSDKYIHLECIEQLESLLDLVSSTSRTQRKKMKRVGLAELLDVYQKSLDEKFWAKEESQ